MRRPRRHARHLVRLLTLCCTLAWLAAACDDDDGGNPDPDADMMIGDTGDTSGTDTDSPDVPDDTDVTDPDADVTDPDADDGTDVPTDTDTGGDMGDAGDMTDTDMPPVTGERVVCENTIPTPSSGLCDVAAGSSDTMLLLQGTVLAGNTIYENGTVLVDATGANGTIVCAGCDCGAAAGADVATVVSCPDGVISPGLINPHDHITFDLSHPATWDPERFEHRHDWRTGARGHSEVDTNPGSNTGREEILYAEVRMLLAGATSVAGSQSNGEGLMRNLDNASLTEGLTGVDVDYRTFPLGDTSGTLRTSNCDYPDIDFSSRAANAPAYLPHIAEGIDAEAENEFRCLSDMSVGEDVILGHTAVVHGIGLSGFDMQLMADRGASLVWSPRSNISLYGDTAAVTGFRNLGVNIALGTDWTASGSMNVLRELKCADYLNANHYGGTFSDYELWNMSTYGAAVAMGADSQIGVIAEGYVADISIFDGSQRADYRAIIDAEVEDVALVLRGGHVLTGDEAIVSALPDGTTGCEVIDVCGDQTAICVQRDTGSLTLASIIAEANAASTAGELPPYDLFFCGTPDNEPTCVPMRPADSSDGAVYTGMTSATDQDGDGIDDATDNCPAVFNPIRPLDNGAQADADDDGVGDHCDVCILSQTDTCTPADPNDRDGDGVPNMTDNCPNDPNDMQEDTDSDDIGNACDACPDYPNPGGTGCLTSIYDIKQDLVADGANVRIEDVIVTAVAPGEGMFVQVPTEATGYMGAEFSGAYVFLRFYTGTEPQRGDCVEIDATLADWFGQWQLSSIDDPADITIVPCNGATIPAAETVSATDVGTMGTLRDNYEGVLVRVENVTVTALDPPAGPGDMDPTNAYVVDSVLRVNDFFHLTSPFPMVNDTFAAITGVLRWANEDSKLEPRDASDLGPPTLVAFTDPLVYLEVGQTTAVDVRLSAPAETDTVVTLGYMNDPSGVLAGPPTSVTVLQGDTTASLTLTASSTSSTTPVTVTATLGTVNESFDVRVYDDTEPRSVVSLTPSMLTLTHPSTETITITLDLPARSTGETVALTPTTSTELTYMVSIPVAAGDTTATFDVTTDGPIGTGTITATLNGTAVLSYEVIDRPLRGVLFSEYVEGTSFNKAIEILNDTGATLDLSTCTVNRYNNGGTSTSGMATLSGTLADQDVFVICHTQFDTTAAATACDLQDDGPTNFNGDDYLELVCGGTVVDSFGQLGNDPGTNWMGNGVATSEQTLRRKCTVTGGDTNTGDAFDPSVEWDTFSQNDFTDLGTNHCL